MQKGQALAHNVRGSVEQLLRAGDVDPFLAGFLLLEHLGAAGRRSTCRGRGSASAPGWSGRGCSARPRVGVVDFVVTAEVAGVVVGDFLVDGFRGTKFSLGEQISQKGGVMNHVEPSAEVGVFVEQGVEAVGTGGDDLLLIRSVVVEHFDVGLGEDLEEVLVAGPAGGVAGALFLAAEDGEIDAGQVHELGGRAGDLLGVRHKPARADPEQHGGVGTFGERLEVESVGPGGAISGGEVPGVGVGFQAFEGPLQLGWELAALLYKVTAQVNDFVDVADEDGALLFAGTAGGAGPEDFGVDDAVDEIGGVERGVGRLTLTRPSPWEGEGDGPLADGRGRD